MRGPKYNNFTAALLGGANKAKVWNFSSGQFTGGAALADYSNVNSSGKFVKDLAGGLYTLRQIAANALPLGNGIGLNPEPGATTINQQSQILTNSYWSKVRSTAQDNQLQAPDGATTAGILTEDTTASSTHILSRSANAISASTAYTYSWFGKRKDFDWIQLMVGDGTSFFWANFNLNTGAVGNKGAGVTAVIEPSYLNGFFRCDISFTSGGSASSSQHNVYMSRLTGNSAGVAPSYSGDGASGVDLWGGMLYASAYPLSYWPAVASAATRSSDVVTRTAGADLSAASGQVTISAHTPLGIGASNQVLWQRDDGTATNRFTVYRRAADRFIVFEVVSGGVTQSSRAIWAVADDTDLTATIAWSGTAMQYTLSGMIAPFIEYSVTMPVGITTERLGCDTGGNQWAGVVKSVTFSAPASLPSYAAADSFNRANTSPGTLGTAPIGSAWVEYGPGSDPLPAATNGYISNKAYIADQNTASYALQSIGHVPATVLQQFSLGTSGGSTGGSSPALLISGLAAGNIATCVHLQVNRSAMNIQKRISGVFTTLATVSYSTLKTDGSLYQVLTTVSTTNVANDTITRRIVGPGLDQTITATDPDLATITGPNVYFENLNTDAVDQAKIEFVAAA